MPKISGAYVSPFYNNVPGEVRSELNYRASAYGNRIRSLAPTEKRDEGAERLLWSYGKIAWAQVIPESGGMSLGTVTDKLMSGADGKLRLYDQQRNVPTYPLLQSLTISNEGTMGSLLKASFDFVVYPKYEKSGFRMDKIEKAYFKPGKEVFVKWGWSVRGGSKTANVGSLKGIVYNFEWSVNGDLSINAKCSVVSKGSIALGISGEQNNPDATGGVQDPLGNEVYDTNLAGILEKDVIQLGGTKNTSVNLTAGSQVADATGASGFAYKVIAIPRSLRDADPDTLSEEQKEKQEEDKEVQQTQEQKNQSLGTNGTALAEQLRKKQLAQQALATAKDDATKESLQAQIDAADNAIYGTRSLYTLGIRTGGLLEKAQEEAGVDGWFQGGAEAEFTSQLLTLADKINKQKEAAAADKTGKTSSSVNTQVYSTEVPEPIAEPTYYVKVSDLVKWFNGKLSGGPLGSISEIQVDGNVTQYLPEVVSTTPDKVYFPDSSKGTYGEFKPFSTTMNNGSDINIGDILMSTTCVSETYKEFLKENQTNITYKNITGFWDAIIKKINYASGETYQLTVRVVESTSISNGKSLPSADGKAILSIEDSNIPTSVKVTPYQFEATIAKPILKSVSISSKPPGPLAAAAFATARGTGGKGQPLDVKTSKSGDNTELNNAIKSIETLKSQMIKVGVSDKFSQDLKGAYSTYKRVQNDEQKAHWLNKAIYPVELSLTIDGINGFHFGNVITTNLVPAQYRDEGLVFTIVKVNHTIKDGVWETTLETKSRLEGVK